MRRFHFAALVTVVVIGFTSLADGADLPTKAPVYKAPIVAPAYSWTGCYVGGNIGYGWQQNKIFDVGNDASAGSDTGTGVVGGGQVGCDYQMQNWVIGAQGMFDWAGVDGSHIHALFPPNESLGTKAKWFGTLTGRIGYAIQPQTLIYAKGGAAWIHNDYTDVDPTVSGFRGNASATRLGWTVGGGLEYAFLRNWSAFIEYDYLNFASKGATMTYVGNCDGWCSGWPYSYKHNLQTILVGINFRFGGY